MKANYQLLMVCCQVFMALLSRFVAAVSACSRYCCRTLMYSVNRGSSLRDLSVIDGIFRMKLRTKYTDEDYRLFMDRDMVGRSQKNSFLPYFTNKTTSVASSNHINNNLITSLLLRQSQAYITTDTGMTNKMN
jgi:hypothetical protein